MRLLENDDPTTQVRERLRSLLQLLSADVAVEFHVDVSNHTSRIVEVPEGRWPSAVARGGDAFLDRLGLTHLAGHDDLPPTRAEELCGAEDRGRDATNVPEPGNARHSLVTARRTGTGVVDGWALDRDRCFGDEELEVLGLFVPYLRRAVVDRERNTLIDDLDQAVSSGAGLLVFHESELVHINGAALGLLEAHRIDVVSILTVAGGPQYRTGELRTAHGVLQVRRRPGRPGVTAVVLSAVAGELDVATLVSPQQHVVLRQLARGSTAASMARHLGLSERTVHKHLQNLYRALGVPDRLNAVRRGRELGLLPLLETGGAADGRQAGHRRP